MKKKVKSSIALKIKPVCFQYIKTVDILELHCTNENQIILSNESVTMIVLTLLLHILLIQICILAKPHGYYNIY